MATINLSGLLKTRDKETITGYVDEVLGDNKYKIKSGQRKVTAKYSGDGVVVKGDRVIAVPSGGGFVIIHNQSVGDVSSFFSIVRIDGVPSDG